MHHCPKPQFISKDSVLLLLPQLRLSSSDVHLVHGLISHYIKSNNTLTTNQTLLVDKLVTRYSKQMSKCGITTDCYEKLTWTNTPIPTNQQSTTATISVNNYTINLYAPYKKTFISELKRTTHGSKWHHETKTWTLPLTPHNLKSIIKLTNDNFNKVELDESITKLLNTMNQYSSSLIWNPTLVQTQSGLVLICSINEPLYEATNHLTLNTDPRTLSDLVAYGVDVTNVGSVIENRLLRDLATKYTSTVEISDLASAIQCLNELGVQCIIGPSSYIDKTIQRKLDQYNIKFVSIYNYKIKLKRTISYPVDGQNPKTVVISTLSRAKLSRAYGQSKVLVLINSTNHSL